MRDAVLAQFPGGEAGALIARPGLVDPDMNGNALVMRAIDGSKGRAPVDSREPAGIAMRQDVDPRRTAFAPPSLGDQSATVLADRAVDCDIRIGNLTGARQSRGQPSVLRHLDQRPP